MRRSPPDRLDAPPVRVTGRAEARIIVDRSRFFAFVFPVAAEAAIDEVVRERRSEVRKANHHCWAYRCRDAAGALVERSRDDGEVGHPGRVLLELLRKHNLEGGIVVSRVFGGVKLGVGGVSRAFREAGEAAVASYLAAHRQ